MSALQRLEIKMISKRLGKRRSSPHNLEIMPRVHKAACLPHTEMKPTSRRGALAKDTCIGNDAEVDLGSFVAFFDTSPSSTVIWVSPTIEVSFYSD